MPAAQGEVANREVWFTLRFRRTITIVTSLTPCAGSLTAKAPPEDGALHRPLRFPAQA
jgi:hypothetical protein